MSSPQSSPSTQPRASSPEQLTAVSHNGFWFRPQNLVSIAHSPVLLLTLATGIAYTIHRELIGDEARPTNAR